ncbi:hypothetical protein BDV38DRAFT_293756 [Aspergillus pseudotamarii]|uniref:Uncharacterized protein n=1 Tax=Aspergillus pseudotamarii TaxID=132259 RepID=A0A5N6SPD0_ASPPS|nr:uncharacterized protein BDV38DRAFT_293756 [Aspergillus pseudotamarii]KAE8136546.1 hypothetical protein BDV38DRAFT_293756 [Aspergillus pseudotamarii]
MPRVRHPFGDAEFGALTTREQQRFCFHHVSIILKGILLACISSSIAQATIGGKEWTDPFAGFIVVAVCLLDLIYGTSLRLIYMAHHVGILLAVQGLEMRYLGNMSEIGMFWGVMAIDISDSSVLFSGMPGFTLHLTLILKRHFAHGDMKMRNIYYYAFYVNVAVTVLEVVSIFYLTYAHRNKLPAAATIGIGTLQVLFTYTKANKCQRIYTVYEEQLSVPNKGRL